MPIDQDDSATWIQLRARLREIRAWAEKHLERRDEYESLIAVLDRPRETLDGQP